MVALSTRCDFPLARSLARQDLADGGWDSNDAASLKTEPFKVIIIEFRPMLLEGAWQTDW